MEGGILNNLRDIRGSRGYTQQQIADRLGIAKSSYSLKENGGRKIDLLEACVLLRLFGEAKAAEAIEKILL